MKCCLVLLLGVVSLPLCFAAGPQFAKTVIPSSGKGMCSGLTPEDFTKVGVPVSALKEANLDGPESAYCMYVSKAGKVEFDIFFPAGATPDDAKGTERTVLAEIGGKFEALHIAGADDAQINAAAPKDKDSASIAVRKGTAVFDINIPQNANARRQLAALAEIVLSRLKP